MPSACYICQQPTFKCDAGLHTHMDLCQNSTEETSHGVCYGCYEQLHNPKICAACRNPLAPLPDRPDFVLVDKLCENCDEIMHYAGKQMTLLNPPTSLAELHGTFPSGQDRYLKVCFSCLLFDFINDNMDHIPTKYTSEELLPWDDTITDYADILHGVEYAERAKEQLMMWIPNIPNISRNTNLNKVLGDIKHLSDLFSFTSMLKHISSGVLCRNPSTRRYIKKSITKKLLSLPIVWHRVEDFATNLSMIFTHHESSEILLKWLMHETTNE
jgi:hypothetical protein